MPSPDIIAAAASIGVPARALAAVTMVESSGSGFGPDGRPVIRVEAHLLWRFTADTLHPLVDAHFHVGGPQPWEGHTFDGAAYHGNQAREWAAFACATGIDQSAAVRATSWGMGQVLGDWGGLGYATPAAFVDAQSTRAGQIDAMARFIRVHGLAGKLAALDWRGFAAAYNGNGKVDDYAAKLADAYARVA